MKDELLDFMAELGNVMSQLEEMKCILQLHLAAVDDGKKDNQIIRSVLNVQMRLVDSALSDGHKLYNHMDGAFLDWDEPEVIDSSRS